MTKAEELPMRPPTYKELYKMRRQAGMRGQPDFYLPKGKILINGPEAHHNIPDWPAKPVSKKAIRKGSRRARKAGLA